MCYRRDELVPTEIEAILFDAGGTLVRVDFAFVADVARRRGAALTEEGLIRAEGAARSAIDEQARANGTPPGDDAGRFRSYFATLLRAAGAAADAAQHIAADLAAAHREDNLWRVPLPGAADTLEGLRKSGLQTAVVSNADGRIERLLTEAGLSQHLDLIVDSHLEGVEKPDPEIFRRALDRLEVAPERAMYVGDIYSIDAVGARAAGIAPVLLDVAGTYGPVDCLKIAALPELLDRIAPRE